MGRATGHFFCPAPWGPYFYIADFQALEGVYSVQQTSMRATTYSLWIVYTFSIHPLKLFPHFKCLCSIVKTCKYLFM